MSERVVIDYLRTRGRVEPPPGFVRSVMEAIAEAPAARSWFSALLPAAAVAGVVAVIAVTVLLLGHGPNVGPGPSPSTVAGATLGELEAAVTAATEQLAEGAVQGRQTYEIDGYLASATWFDWRPGGDQVVVTRTDVDVSAPWWMDPDGEPRTVGERIDERIEVIAGGHYYFSREGGWVAPLEGPRGPLTWAVGMLSGEIPPLIGVERPDQGVATQRRTADGGTTWTLQAVDGTGTAQWFLDPDGMLVAFVAEGVDVTMAPSVDLGSASTRTEIEFTAWDDTDPIIAPDLDSRADPADYGVPADVPLDPGDADAAIDHREYVEVALDALETYHGMLLIG